MHAQRDIVPAMTTPPTLTVTESVAAELRAVVARQNVSRRVLAERLEVSAMWVQRRLSGQQDITVEDIVRICRALEVDPMPLLEHALTP